MKRAAPIDHKTVAFLGIETICVYGAWWYSFGVLLDPILEDTGWRESVLAGAFSFGTAIMGIGSVFGGRLLDRLGSRPVFVIAAMVGGTALFGTSIAQDEVTFFVGTGVALGAFGALGFYHVTMTAAVRSSPAAPTRAIAILTIWGALASAIYLPTAAWLVNRTDWRVTIRILGVTAVVALLLAAVFAPVGPATTPGRRQPLKTVFAATWTAGPARGFTITVGLVGISFTTLLVYQVPVMVAAGLPLTTAATAAAVRGFCQLGGRLPLSPLITRFGSSGSVLIAVTALAAGGVLLIFSGNVIVALCFAVIAGFGIGAWSPLQGIRAAELFDSETLGATMGLFTTVAATAGALGPLIAGVISEQTGDRRWGAVICVTSAIAALIVFSSSRERNPAGPAGMDSLLD